MQARWTVLMMPSFIVAMILVAGPQLVFLRGSFFEDLGTGLLGTTLTAQNYAFALTDPFYRGSFGLTVFISLMVVLASLALAYPAAYILARMPSRIAMILLALTVISAFVSVVIKVLGLFIIFGAEGPINKVLLGLHVIDVPVHILGTNTGVVVGIMHYVLAFMILVLFSVILMIPRELEEAAQIHGASRWRVYWRVIIPLSLPAVVSTSLIIFNLSMGAFVSAALLGGGKVLTLPVIVQKTIMLEGSYGLGGALAAVLLVSVLLMNLCSVYLISRWHVAKLTGG